jgi:hypothetical protein
MPLPGTIRGSSLTRQFKRVTLDNTQGELALCHLRDGAPVGLALAHHLPPSHWSGLLRHREGAQQLIIAFEGAPAAGKSTSAEYLAAHQGALRIPEVNVLFDRPDDEPHDWYFERQLERWDMATEANATHPMAILDGDPYQPVLFNWIYPEKSFAPWNYVLDYFVARPERALMPDFYVHMVVTDTERKRREFQREAARGYDPERARAKYGRWSGMALPQTAYFRALGEAFPGFVMHHEAIDGEETAARIAAYEYPDVPADAVFAFMRTWLTEHDPGEFAD